MHANLSPGGSLPELAPTDHNGVVRSLSELAGGDPLVVHFYRGWFCPKERAWSPELRALGERAEVAYTGVVSISVDPPDVQAALRAGMVPAGLSSGIRIAPRGPNSTCWNTPTPNTAQCANSVRPLP